MSQFRQKGQPVEVKVWLIVKKTIDNLSKTVRGAHFRTFCSQYLIAPIKNTYF